MPEASQHSHSQTPTHTSSGGRLATSRQLESIEPNRERNPKMHDDSKNPWNIGGCKGNSLTTPQDRTRYFSKHH